MNSWLWTAVLAGSIQGSDGTVVKSYSLAALRASAIARPQMPPYGGFLPGGEEPATAAPFFTDGEVRPPGLAEILDFVRAALGPDADRSTLSLLGDRLVVQAGPAQQSCVAATLRDLEAALATPVELEVRVFLAGSAATDLPAQSSLTKEQADALERTWRSEGVLLWASLLDAPPGELVEGGPCGAVPFVATVHTEVAKKSTIAEPVVRRIPVGARVACQAFPAAGGGSIYLCISASYSKLRSLTPFQTRATDVGTIEIPRVEGIRLASAAHVEAGGALVLAARHPELGVLRVLCRPRWRGRVQRLGAGAGARPVLVLRTPSFLSNAGRQLPRFDEDLTMTRDPAGPSSPGLELLRGKSPPSRLMRSPSGQLFVAGDADAVDAFFRQVIQIETESSRNAELDVRVVRADDEAKALDSRAEVLESAAFAIASQASAGALVLSEETAVTQYRTPIAEEAAIATPEVANLLRGLVLRIRVLDIGETCRAEFDLLRCTFGPRERVVSDATHVGDWERVPSQRTSLWRVADLRAGVPVLLGELGSADGGRAYAIVTFRVR